MKKRIFFTVTALIIVGALLLFFFPPFPLKEIIFTDPVLKDIQQKGELFVITRNNPHTYYIYRGEKMGFEYDLAKAFSDFLNVKLNIRTDLQWEEMIEGLYEGKGHLIASSMTITPKRKQQVLFSEGYLDVVQHIIVHRHNRKVKNVNDLNGKTVHVRKATSYVDQLKKLRSKGIDLKLNIHENTPTEELIRQVAEKEIEITVSDNHIARLNRRYYPEAILAGAIGKTEKVGWAVHPRARSLLKKINLFFDTIKKNGMYDSIWNRYFEDVDTFNYVDLAVFHRRVKSRLPKYLPHIKKAAKQNHFDWRLIAAQIYQESHFNAHARSPSGAYGLMQLTRRTARKYKVKNIYNPAENINAGVKYLKRLYDFFDKATGTDRLFISLAAYNIGQGHILDARNLARDMELDPNKWSSLEKTLPMLSKRKYYKDAIYGYARGRQPVEYIRNLMIFYDILIHLELKNAPDVTANP